MSRNFKTIAVIGAGAWGTALAQTAARGTLSEFMGAIYAAPPGWQEQTQTSFRTLVAPAARPGQLLIVMIRTAQPATKDAEAELNALADNAEAKTRRLSRGDAMRQLDQQKVDEQYRRDHILVNLDGRVPLDESSACYKSAEEVIAAVVGAGLARIDNTLWPVASIKGSEEGAARERRVKTRDKERRRDHERDQARKTKGHY